MGPDHGDRRHLEFEEVALVHMQRIYNAALRLTRNKPEAEDLFQETYLRAYRFFYQFRQGTDCRAWLFTILRNLFFNRVRQASSVAVDFDEDRVYREAKHGSLLPQNPEIHLVHRLVGEDIQQAILALPPKLRLVVVLADLEGCSYREIAEICQCPIGTVMSRLYRGRQALRTALRDYAKSEKTSKEDG